MDSKWTADRDAVWILFGDSTVNKDRRYLYYHVSVKFNLIEADGVRRVRRKRGSHGLAVILRVSPAIIRDMHVASGHIGEKKGTRKL